MTIVAQHIHSAGLTDGQIASLVNAIVGTLTAVYSGLSQEQSLRNVVAGAASQHLSAASLALNAPSYAPTVVAVVNTEVRPGDIYAAPARAVRRVMPHELYVISTATTDKIAAVPLVPLIPAGLRAIPTTQWDGYARKRGLRLIHCADLSRLPLDDVPHD